MNASEGKEGREQESNMVKGNRMAMKLLVHVEKSLYKHVCLTAPSQDNSPRASMIPTTPSMSPAQLNTKSLRRTWPELFQFGRRCEVPRMYREEMILVCFRNSGKDPVRKIRRSPI